MLSDACLCGNKKVIKFTRKSGWSNEYFQSTQKELGGTLGLDLASVSAKISRQSNLTLSISKEETMEDEDTYEAPKCGKQSIEIYQLFTKWHIREDVSEGWLMKKKKQNIRDFEVPENEYYPKIKILDKTPECGDNCFSPSSYNVAARLEFPGGNIDVPATVSQGEVLPFGIDEPLSKGQSVEIEKLPVQIPRILGLRNEKNAKITDYETLPSGQVSLKLPESQILGVPLSEETLHRNFEDWWNTVPDYLKFDTQSVPGYSRPIVFFNAINDALFESHFHPKEIEPPSKSELQDWLQKIGT